MLMQKFLVDSVLICILAFIPENGVFSFNDWKVPVLTEEPPYTVEFYNTQGTVVRCAADGRPAPKISWVKRDGTAVAEKVGLRHVRADGSLVFPPFRSDEYRPDIHATVYRCAASNIVGALASREVHVRAVVSQQFDVRVYDEFVILGNTAVLKCHIPTFVEDFVDVTAWYRDDGRVFHADGSEGGKYSVLPGGELHILNVQQQDGFRGYRCQVKLRLTGETKQSLTAGRLIVKEPHSTVQPQITHRESEVRVQEGDQVIMPCAAQAYPPPTYNWYKIRDGRRIPVKGGQRVSQYAGTLTVRNAKVDDGGQFICVVNNSVGQQIVTTELVISVTLRATISPTEHRAQLGQSVTFNCSVSGRPEPSVTWVKNLLPVESDGERVRIAALSRLLSISNVRREDKGIYQCLLSNGFDSAQGAASLVLGDASPVLDSVFEEQTLHPGGPVSLKCSATGSPLPQVTWRLDGLPLPDLLRYRVGDYVTRDSRVVSYVNITSLRSEDGGYYECAASNEVGRVSHEGRITVTGPPAVRYMPNVTLLAGGKLKVRCPAGGSVSSITWERDGRSLPQNHRQEVFANGTLVVRQVNRKSDEGRYTCVVKSLQGTLAKGDVFIQVLVGPRIDSFSFPPDLEEGMRSVAVCAAIAGDSPLTLTWLKDGKPLEPELNAMVDSVNNFTSTLTFNKVGSKHGGSYTCVATNPAASVNHTAKMVVNVSPYWTVQPSDAMAVVGSHVTLDCQSEGHPTPQIRWKSNSALESASANYQTVISNPHVQILENGSLIIREVTSTDAGDYMCQATNGVSPGLSAVVKLSVHVPAHFATKFQSMTAKKGETLRLTCEALGEQPLMLRWTKDKQSLENNLPDSRYNEDQKVNENGTTSTMTISSAERTDSALFSCQTSNKYGEDEQNIQVIILERPDTPKDLQVKGLTSRSATVSWVQPFSGNTPLTGYILQYQLAPENSKEDSKTKSEIWKDDVKSLTIPPTDVSVDVKGLFPITTYHFRVFAENTLGRSKTSEIVSSTTLEEAPSAPPSDISIEALSSQILKVTWKAPVEDYPKGQVTGYYLGYKELDSKEQLQYKTLKATSQPIQEYRLKNLHKFTKYAVRVQAFNSAGSGPASDDKIAQTLQYDPPAPPVVRLSTVEAISARVEWGPGDETPVTAYIMSIREEQLEWIDQRFSSDTISYDVKPLKCGTRYQLRLIALNSVGSGEPSDIVQFKTEGTAPVAPSKPVFLNINSTFVLLNLDTWQTGGCPVNSFIVQYKSTGESDWLLVSSNIQATTEPLIISDLTPGTWYNVLMTARNDAGATDAEYVFATLTESGDPVSPVSHGSVHSQSSFYRLLSIVVPLVCAGVIVLVVTVVVGIVVTRRHAPQRYGPRQDGDDGGDNRSNANHKMDNMGMTSIGSKKGRSPYEAPKESLYFPAPYATSRLAAYAAEDGSECDSLPSSTRTTGDRNMSNHTYDVPFPVRRPEAEEQYTRIKRVPVPSVPVNNIYQTPQLPESERWTRRLSYHHQGLERSNLEPGFSFKVDSPATRRWSGGYRIPFRKDQPFKLKRIDQDSYRYSDEGSDLEDEDERPEEISEAECDRSLTVMIPPENKNFYILTGTVQ